MKSRIVRYAVAVAIGYLLGFNAPLHTAAVQQPVMPLVQSGVNCRYTYDWSSSQPSGWRCD